MSIDWSQFVAIVEQHESFLLTSHMRADCDALGSELAIAHALRSLGKRVTIMNGDAVPPHISFLDVDQEILALENRGEIQTVPPVDVIMVLDTSAWSQLGPMADIVRSSPALKVVLDHHISEDDLGAIPFKDTSAEATGRLALEAVEALGVVPTSAMATAMFAAIATDTGWFRFNSVTDATFSAAARLVRLGAQPADVFAHLYEQNSFARIRLQGRILVAAKSELDGRLMHSSITQADLDELGAEPTDTEDVINRLLTVADAEVALLFLELAPQLTKVSLRSRSAFDVRKLAEKFAGGGHKAAAGVRFPGSLASAEKAMLDAVRSAMG